MILNNYLYNKNLERKKKKELFNDLQSLIPKTPITSIIYNIQQDINEKEQEYKKVSIKNKKEKLKDELNDLFNEKEEVEEKEEREEEVEEKQGEELEEEELEKLIVINNDGSEIDEQIVEIDEGNEEEKVEGDEDNEEPEGTKEGGQPSNIKTVVVTNFF